MRLEPGDRVELATVNGSGVVEHADAEHVRVKWDGGKVGLLYFDGRMLADARHLLKLRRVSS